ncbi:MAG: c-type cytochrome [Thermoguttaceae bacterium]|nr:c-type cytochrome [Thermoguttaceae bacterium]
MSIRAHLATVAAAALVLICAVSSAAEYKGPIKLLPTKDGSTLYSLNKDSHEIAVVSVAEGKVERSIPIPGEPNDMTLSSDEKTMYVGYGDYQGKICAIDLGSGEILGEGVIGHTPRGLCVNPADESVMFACLQFDGKIAKVSLPDFKVLATYPALHEPCDAVITPDGKTYYVANFLPLDRSDGANVAAEITCLDTATGESKNIRLPNGSSSMHHICLSPDGKWVYTTAILARYQLPTTQVERGWMNTNGFSIIDAEKREFVNTVLLDDVDSGAANPWPIAVTPDNKTICVGIAGTHELCLVDSDKTHEKLASLPKNAEEAKEKGLSNATTADQVPQLLAFLVGLKKRVKLSNRTLKVKGPRSLAIIDNKAYVGMYFSDVIMVVDLKARTPKAKEFCRLGPEPEMDAARRGELAWHDATLCFQNWQSCASCHPEARSDALNWDLLNDGMGNPKNAKGMLHSLELPPAMWHGVRVNAEKAIRTGFQYIMFSNVPEETCVDVEHYLKSLRQLPSPKLVNGELSEKALRGKAVFENEKYACAQCHVGEYFTDQKMHDVGSRADYDHQDDFDTPTLRGIWRTPPYMHDGRYVDLKDVFLDGGHGDVLGDVGDMTEEEVDDLVEYLLSI